MEFDPSRRPDDVLRESRDDLRRALRRRPLPVTALAGPTDLPPGRLGGWEAFNGTATCLTVAYGAPDVSGPWVTVQTARWTGNTTSGTPLRTALEENMRIRQDRFATVEWGGEDRVVTIDGRAVAGHRLRAGERWWALRCSLRDLEITVVAYGWDGPFALRILGEPEVQELISVVPVLPAYVPAPPEPVETVEGEPHRLLVEAVLRSDSERARWMADGGPAPSLPRNWPTLWRSAVLRQADLAGQTHEEAQNAVQLMVNQLVGLQHEAAWFRADTGLRERAISETLIFGTGLSTDVPSRDAQAAWLRRQGLRPGEHARIESLSAARTFWIEAWHTWARSRTA